MRIAIYDLDRTITRSPTFTPFLHFAAARIAPWRLLFSPLWIVLMLGYRLGFYSRTRLKQMGMRLMTGSADLERLEAVGRGFAARRIAAGGLMPETLQLIEADRQAGAVLLLATAAFGFYASAFAAHLGIAGLVATRWDGKRIPGGNCYGEEKKARVLTWLTEKGIDPASVTIRFVSDSFADAPLLDMAQDAVFVTGSRTLAARARARGWRVIAPAA